MDGRGLALGALALLAGGTALAKGSRAGSRAEPVELPRGGPTERASVVAGELSLQGRPQEVDLRSKVRQAYRWITNEAIVVPYFDMHFGADSPTAGKAVPALSNESESYSAYVLLPLLTLLTARRALLLGGPGRGKTTSALVLAMISGMNKEQLRASIVRGHPQLMVSDLLGSPLPKSLVEAKKMKDIEVSWRSWITDARVKIIDEYNRIPTKTQSALLSLMAEGYAEMFDKYVQTGRARPGLRRSGDAWFLTANDDQGGGTFQVIEALKDRIDVVVRATPFNPAFSDRLVERLARGSSPEEMVPDDIVFSNEELDAVYDDILKVEVPAAIVDKIGFFMGSLEFCRKASPIFEYKIKDTLKLSGTTVSAICNESCPLDKKVHLCTQTENGISVRALQAILHYAKALAWFRGKSAVTWADVRAIVPWILHDKLVSNPRSQFFQADPENTELLRDKVAWIGQLVDKSAGMYPKYEKVRDRARAVLSAARLGGFQNRAEIDARMSEIFSLYNDIVNSIGGSGDQNQLNGFVYDLLTSLRMTYSRYTDFLKGSASRRKR
jgi:MoxR-like ATPase